MSPHGGSRGEGGVRKKRGERGERMGSRRLGEGEGGGRVYTYYTTNESGNRVTCIVNLG